ncbi:hypothetical protein IWW34DRAFT_716100 [Fusarium oxysporum f. sp. albedinis]|nr:hypothetical protein IWW34DRAFT_716100 [Fusarium oxysporum f. sp. albedinis]
MKDPTTFGDMSNPTRTTANFAVASAQRASIARTCSSDMSRLMLEPWIDPMGQGG